ncbi:hypothetical protein O6H91_16G063000 [Diphasiastrum complanatum]|uniref:Uncharacterized protein n=1 Tax=Diphasiastrum complanatum TaxID=34168 RepID=A0ACC2BCU8_DIPCM|nr:hypothetical protein O6H91_16G063000 [Diphasiastrum complanatum]
MDTVSARFEKYQTGIRNFRKETDLYQVTELERRCGTGLSGTMSLYADMLGDPLCRVRHFPAFAMLVAEVDGSRIVGLVRAGVKDVVCGKKISNKNHDVVGKVQHEEPVYARVGYVLGLRVCPFHRRLGIGLRLAQAIEDWCKDEGAEFVYMATEKSNTPSIDLFTKKLGYKEIRMLRILVHPIFFHSELVPLNVRVTKLVTSDALTLYTSVMGSRTFFPRDIDMILKNELYEGTWIATLKQEEELGLVSITQYSNPRSRGSKFVQNLLNGVVNSWAMLSIWKCNEILKLQVVGVPKKVHALATITRFVDHTLPWLKIPSFPDVFSPFGMQFIFGIHAEGPNGHKLLDALCCYAHNIAQKHNCQVIMTELSSFDPLANCIPYWKTLSSADDLWCMKYLNNKILDEKVTTSYSNHEFSFDSFNWCKSIEEAKIFVDPRDV